MRNQSAEDLKVVMALPCFKQCFFWQIGDRESAAYSGWEC
jgi:hypothetical protein